MLVALEQAGALLVGQAMWMLVLALIFTLVNIFPKTACDADKAWWQRPGLVTDLSYAILTTVIAPYLNLSLQIFFAMVLWIGPSGGDFDAYIAQGSGVLAAWPLWAQAIVYLVFGDFLLYWIHRLFHQNSLWPFHAVHHSATEIDWTTAYRTHPVNYALDGLLVHVVLLLIGISPTVMMWFVPFNVITAAMVHANLNWTFGPLRTVIASPIFHRWHHGLPGDGGDKNFGATFSFWDVMFGTFHMPKERLPQTYGVGDYPFPSDLGGQIVAPFRIVAANIWRALKRPRAAAPLRAQTGAVGQTSLEPGTIQNV